MTPREHAENAATDIWDSTKTFGTSDRRHVTTLIAAHIKYAVEAATLEEREACAQIAEADRSTHAYEGEQSVQEVRRATCHSIAAEIRKRTP